MDLGSPEAKNSTENRKFSARLRKKRQLGSVVTGAEEAKSERERPIPLNKAKVSPPTSRARDSSSPSLADLDEHPQKQDQRSNSYPNFASHAFSLLLGDSTDSLLAGETAKDSDNAVFAHDNQPSRDTNSGGFLSHFGINSHTAVVDSTQVCVDIEAAQPQSAENRAGRSRETFQLRLSQLYTAQARRSSTSTPRTPLSGLHSGEELPDETSDTDVDYLMELDEYGNRPLDTFGLQHTAGGPDAGTPHLAREDSGSSVSSAEPLVSDNNMNDHASTDAAQSYSSYHGSDEKDELVLESCMSIQVFREKEADGKHAKSTQLAMDQATSPEEVVAEAITQIGHLLSQLTLDERTQRKKPSFSSGRRGTQLSHSESGVGELEVLRTLLDESGTVELTSQSVVCCCLTFETDLRVDNKEARKALCSAVNERFRLPKSLGIASMEGVGAVQTCTKLSGGRFRCPVTVAGAVSTFSEIRQIVEQGEIKGTARVDGAEFLFLLQSCTAVASVQDASDLPPSLGKLVDSKAQNGDSGRTPGALAHIADPSVVSPAQFSPEHWMHVAFRSAADSPWRFAVRCAGRLGRKALWQTWRHNLQNYTVVAFVDMESPLANILPHPFGLSSMSYNYPARDDRSYRDREREESVDETMDRQARKRRSSGKVELANIVTQSTDQKFERIDQTQDLPEAGYAQHRRVPAAAEKKDDEPEPGFLEACCMEFLACFCSGKGSAQIDRPLLPPGDHRNTLVLDLDETLIHSTFDDPPASNPPDFTFSIVLDYQVHKVNVYVRPGCIEFLQKMASLFEIVVWTASIKQYAHPLLNKLDPNGYVTHRLCRSSCTPRFGNYVKDLGRLGRDLTRVVIVDNSPFCYMMHPNNAIPIASFTFDKSDRKLMSLTPTLTELAKATDMVALLNDPDFQDCALAGQ